MSDLRIGGVPIAKLKVAELKAELEARELSKTGKKDELVARLISFMEVNECSEPSSENSSRTETPNAEVSELWAKQREEMLAAAQKNKEEAERKAAEEEAAQLAEEEEQRRRKEEERAERQRKAEEAKRIKEEEKRKKEEEKQKLAEEKAEKARHEAEEKERRAEEEEAQRELEKKRVAQEQQAKKEADQNKAAEEAERAKAERKAAEEKAKVEKRAAEENARKIKLAAEEAERWMEEKKQQEEEKRREEVRKKEEERKKEVARLKEEKAKAEQRAKEEREQKKREEEEKRRAEEEKKRADNEKAKEEEQRKRDEERKQREEDKKRRESEREKDEQRKKDRQKRFEEEEKKKQEASTNGKSRGADEKKATPAGEADEEALDFEPETAADDALVMEVDQHDLVDQEEKEEVISAQPGEVTSLRKLGGNRVQGERKRGWGASGARLGSGDAVAISSNTLKDLVPDPKNLLEKPDVEIEDELGADVAGPKAPKGQEPPRKRKKIPEADLNETEVIIITNLTRPFTVNQLKEMLKRTGTIVDFWIDRIKSKCCVEFTTTDQASETRMALDGVTWPQSNPKTLRVSFGTKEEMKKLAEGGEDAGVIGRLGVELEGRSLLRDWDRNKVDQEKERERERLDERRGRREVRERSIEEPAPVATKSLEELFKKTTAGPAIYWRPLSDEEIQAKIDEKNKKVDEAKSQKDMMASKEAQEKTKRMGEALGLVPASNRKRSRSSSGSPR